MPTLNHIWLGSDPPATLRRNAELWKDLNPGLTVTLWDEEDAQEFALYRKLSPKMVNAASKSALLRLILLVNMPLPGEVEIYADHDVEPLAPVAPLLDELGEDAFALPAPDHKLTRALPFVDCLIVRKGEPAFAEEVAAALAAANPGAVACGFAYHLLAAVFRHGRSPLTLLPPHAMAWQEPGEPEPLGDFLTVHRATGSWCPATPDRSPLIHTNRAIVPQPSTP